MKRRVIHFFVEETKGFLKIIQQKAKTFIQNNDGMGTVEIILIIVVLVGLVVIFKGRINNIVSNLFDKITSQTSGI